MGDQHNNDTNAHTAMPLETANTIKNEELESIVARIKSEHPHWKLKLIVIPGREDEVYICRVDGWGGYKTLLDGLKDSSSSAVSTNENMIQKYLIYPKVGWEKLQDMEPGLITSLVSAINKAQGFLPPGVEAEVKNL